MGEHQTVRCPCACCPRHLTVAMALLPEERGEDRVTMKESTLAHWHPVSVTVVTAPRYACAHAEDS